jgi:hypothetical protein
MTRLLPAFRAGVILVIVGLFLLRAYASARGLMAVQPLGIDFLPMWTGARMAWSTPQLLYDFEAVTAAQDWLMTGWSRLRPFVYPPSALPALAPFAAMPFHWAYVVWTLLGAVLLAGATAQAVERQRILAVALILASPPAATAIIVGQTTLLVAGLLVLGVTELAGRPRLAGALFGIAAAIKPQAAVLVPVALVAARAWGALGSAILAGAAMGLVSLVMFGWEPWMAWLHSLPRFAEAISLSPTLMRGGVTLTMMGVNLGLDPDLLGWIRLAALLAAVAATWLAFARSGDAAYRLAALSVGALSIMPYAMHYEATLMAPAAVLLALSPHRWLFGAAALASLALAMRHQVGGASVVAVATCAVMAALHGRYRNGVDSSRS